MAKGSVRKKGKKWYYRFYVEDASGNLVQKECVGTESKSETEKLLRHKIWKRGQFCSLVRERSAPDMSRRSPGCCMMLPAICFM